MFYVYIIKSEKDKKLYIGFTNDLRSRLVKHNNNLVKSTSFRAPFELIYYEAYKSEEDARIREKRLKYFGKAYGQLKGRIHNSLK